MCIINTIYSKMLLNSRCTLVLRVSHKRVSQFEAGHSHSDRSHSIIYEFNYIGRIFSILNFTKTFSNFHELSS